MAMFGRKEKKEEKVKVSKSSLKKAFRLYRFVVPYIWYLIAGLVFLLLSSSATLIFPWLLGDLLNAGGVESINKIGLILLGVFFMNAIFSYCRIILFENVAQRSLALLRQTTYAHLIRLPMNFFATRRVGELNSRISADISLLQSTFTTTTAEFLRQVLTIVAGVGLLLTISPKLTLFMLGIVPVIMLVAVFFGRYIRKLSKAAQDEVAESNTIVEETLQGVNNVKSFANELFEIERYNKSTNNVVSIAIKAAKYRGAFVSFIIFGLFGSIAGVIWYGSILTYNGEIDFGRLVSFVLYTVFVGASIGGIADLYAQLLRAVGATEHLMEILDESTEDIAKERLTSGEAAEEIKLEGGVQFDQVSFEYPSRPDIPVLKKISFEVKPGEEVALVGPSGAGKSTIVSLLLRFYDPVSGQIKIDGKDIQSYNLTGLRNQMAIVPQEVLLFGGSIRENIAYGKPGASDEEIRHAAEQANALDFIEQFPEGLDTIVGERGIQLSGGQRQRIAIARAVLKNPSILILDEATSSLDSESERLVQEALERLMKGRTSFVVAHRLSTIKKANQILVIDGGEIKETGTHEELIKLEKGIYANLSQLQFNLNNEED
ncbi:ATP-binding cassette domain-containing protein [bacterium SCSIO 12741]|nr:ATP-binding cassette domain-containing protein [bacterium SCSIO 12741]